MINKLLLLSKYILKSVQPYLVGGSKKGITKDTIILQANKILYMARDGFSTYMDIDHLVMFFAKKKNNNGEMKHQTHKSQVEMPLETINFTAKTGLLSKLCLLGRDSAV